MQQDNSEMETSHEKNIYLIIITIITVVCIIAGSLYHIGGFALGLFDNLIPRSDKSLGNVCTEELSVDEFSNLVFDTTISNINVKPVTATRSHTNVTSDWFQRLGAQAIPSQYPKAKEPTTEETPQVKSLLPFLRAQH